MIPSVSFSVWFYTGGRNNQMKLCPCTKSALLCIWFCVVFLVPIFPLVYFHAVGFIPRTRKAPEAHYVLPPFGPIQNTEQYGCKGSFTSQLAERQIKWKWNGCPGFSCLWLQWSNITYFSLKFLMVFEWVVCQHRATAIWERIMQKACLRTKWSSW